MCGNRRKIVEYQGARWQGFGQGASALAGLYQNWLTIDGQRGFGHLLGLDIAQPSSVFFPRLLEVGNALGTLSPAATTLGLGSLLLVLAFQRWVRSVPGAIVALVLGTLAVRLFGLDVDTIGSRFGGIPQSLPGFALPDFSWEGAKQLFIPTVTIALLGATSATWLSLATRPSANSPPTRLLPALGIATTTRTCPVVGSATGLILVMRPENVRPG